MLFIRFSNIISIYTLHFYFTKMKHKSTKNVNNNVIKNVYVLFILISISFAQNKVELKQADSLSSKELNNEVITTLNGNIIFQNNSTYLYGDVAVQSNRNDILKIFNNVKIIDEEKTIICDSLFYDMVQESIELFGNVQLKNLKQTVSSNFGIIDKKNDQLTLKNKVKIKDGETYVEGDNVKIKFKNRKIDTIKIIENGIIFSNNYGFEKNKLNQNKKIKNVDILKGKLVNINLENDLVSGIELVGMASSFIHLYEDSLYQGNNNISGDKIILFFENNEASALEAIGGVIGEFNPSETNQKSPENINYVTDRVKFDVKSNQSQMYGNAQIVQPGFNITAAQIDINLNRNILEAYDYNPFNKKDALIPTLIEDGREPISGKSMVYNTKSKKGKIVAASTSMQENKFFGKQIITKSDSTFYIEDCIFTSCDPKKFYIGSKQAKIIYGDKIILKPLKIVVGGVPIFGIPKAIFPHSNNERKSGWIMPSFGSSDNRGNYLDGLGYYFAPNDYFGSENSIIFADRQGLIFKSKNQYKNRYKFNGDINFEIRRHLSSTEKDIAKLNENNNTDFSINWNHNQILRNDQTLKSNVSYFSNGEYNRETSIDLDKRLNQQAISNATYSKRWKNKNLSMSVNVSNKQDLMSKNKVNSSSSFYQNPTSLYSSITKNNSTLPSLNFRVGRRNLFRNSNVSFLKTIQWDFNSKILNSSKNYYRSQEIIDEEGVINYQWEQDDDGNAISFNQKDMMLKNKFSINAPFTVFKYVAINPNINISSDFVNRFQEATINENNDVTLNTINSFKNRTISNFTLSISTKVYGILPFKVGSFQSIRHVMTPRIGLSYSPNYLNNDNYFQEFNEEYYDYFSGTLIGSTPKTSNRKISLALGNVFQAKRKINDRVEKIDLFSFRINTGYDINKEEFKLSNLNSSFRSNLKNGTNIDINLTHDFYKFNKEDNRRINEIQSLPRLTGVRLSTNFNLKVNNFKSQNKNEFSENTKNFLNDFSSNGWQSKIGVSYTINKINPENKIENFWLNSNTSINVTSNWKLNYNARFNLIDNNIVRHNLTLYREIDCWELFIDWTPNGYAKGLYFRLNLKSDMLQDLKVEQKTGIYTTRPSF